MSKNRDLHHDCDVVPAYAGGTISTDTATNGIGIDRSAYESATFALYSGAITDGTYTLKLQHSDTDSSYADCGTDDVLGAAVFTGSNDNAVKRISYIGYKKWVRMVITSASTSSGGVFKGAVAVLYSPKHAPVADN